MKFSVYDSVPIGVCVLKRDRRDLLCLYANEMLQSMLGSAPEGQPLEQIWPVSEAAELARRLKGPTPPTEATLPFTRGGKTRWALLTISHGQYEGEDCFTLWATDVSASKEIEESLKQRAQQADAIAEQKSNFLATISHEIRTPMQTVYGLLEMIELERPSPNILTMAQTARNSASGLLEILDDVLDFAKMDADQMELDHFEVPVRTLARGVIEALSVKVQGKDIALHDEVDSDVPFVVVGDPKRLRQIIINLMSNAMKFTQSGSVTIRIRMAQHAPAPSRGIILRFEVIDTGIGMSEEVTKRLFHPFSQADNSTSRKFGGTGLGLSICKKLVGLMGGQIGVTSEPGKGSTFWFEIPTEEVSTESTALDLPKLDGLSVLSVEDHPMGAKEIVKSLRSMGASVDNCPTIEEALNLVRRRPYDVGVIDQGLPDGLGLDLIREIMQIRPFMGLVMYTARDDSGLQHSLQSMGVSYLVKPASRIGLGEAIHDAARKSQKIDTSGPRRLLIAEDTASMRDVFSRQLSYLNVEATFVENGQEALDFVRTGEYGLLVTDLHMPIMDGYGLVQAIREDDKRLGGDRHFPVIALTADVQMAQRQIYMSYEFDECLLKPVSLGQLRRLLIRWGLLNENTLEQQEGRTPDASLSPPAQAASAIDREAMVAQMGAFDENAIDMLKLFIDMTAPLLAKLLLAAEHNDYHDLREISHSLKGAARSACLNDLGNTVASLQIQAELRKDCQDLVLETITQFERARKEIEAL